MKKTTAFTLLELIVVMAVVSIMSGLGIQGLIIFRQTIQYQQAETDIITVINDVKNKARNSVASPDLISGSVTLPNALVDAYAIDFVANNYSLRRCSITVSFGNKSASCINLEASDLKPEVLSSVNVYPIDATKCRALVFERLTGNIAAIPALTGALDETGVCTIRVQHANNTSLFRDFTVDLGNNSSDIF